MRRAVDATRQAISPRLAMRIFLNMVCSRGEIALCCQAARAIWLRRCAALRLVATVGDEVFFKHGVLPWR